MARAVNLRLGDLPQGFQRHPGTGSPTAQSDPSAGAFARCVGATPPKQMLAAVSSDHFTYGTGLETLDLTSEVDVMPSMSAIQRDLRAIRSPRIETCGTDKFRGMTRQTAGGVRLSNVRFARFPVPSSGTEGAFGFRAVVTATKNGRSIPIFIDTIGFAVGHAEVTISPMSYGRPFPGRLETQVYTELMQRARSLT